MKLFKQLLVAPAVLGLLAPLAPAAIADEQVTSIGQFSDVKPTGWEYQALSNLIERYGCVAGYPNGTYKGGQAITRFEAAALLNACLDRVTETTDELKKLMSEFQKELTILKGRVDGLDARVGTLEANQFSTTTKLSGLATFVVGGVSYSGSAYNSSANTVNRSGGRSAVTNVNSNVTFNYDLQLTLDTSFTGKDLLRTNLRAGNFGSSAFGGEPHGVGNSAELEIAFEEDSGADALGIDKLYYQFPIGKQFTATFGARVGQEDMLALWPSVYPADTVLNLFTVNGAPAAYSKNLGAGAGLWWQNKGWSVSANYVSNNGSDSSKGLFTENAGGTATVQLGYQQEQWGLAAIWSYVQPLTQFVPGTTPLVHGSIDHGEAVGAQTNAFGLSGFWQPLKSGWAPSISVGWGINNTTYSVATTGRPSVSQSWMAGLQWTDVFAKGNDFGFALGQAVFATSLTGGATPNDSNYAFEWWYKIQVTDNISITPALFYLNRPLGQRTPADESFHALGALVKTTFKF
ncbi:carbohydrate porin [Cyanobium sp. HWJ4-Hawea]|uniref:iron uptake porin n=1 Tax=Cyanobium sp. HWJ4-Hawea TaxID=2823713 RepID=UPI0020CED1B1|nr:iron uptake porin [Cyanobium sp. HWJ4-Hawea]MCP9809663.1 carbohydrate porin [Cyanobium sp. HWJ4-Hawea]